jgi:predicted nucleotidyltransferase
MKKTQKDIEPILEEVKKSLQKIYGEKLKGIILYGSYARGDATEDSDIDIIVLLGEIRDFDAELDTLFEVIGQVDFKYDTLISVLPLEEKQYLARRLPVILNAKREGVSI